MKKNTTRDTGNKATNARLLRNLWPSILLIALFCLAVSVRLNYLPQWIEQPDRAFYSGEPLLTSVDGYYYLSLSQDLLEGRYEPVNELRGGADHPSRPMPPPLLSWLAYIITKVSGISLNWVAMILPVLLGSLIIFPVYWYGKKFNGPFMGVSSSIFAVFAYSYVLRTRVGAFDTDCLIVSLVLAIGFFLWMAATADKLLFKGGNVLAALLSTLLLYLWWEQTPEVVFTIFIAYLFLVLVFFYRPNVTEGRISYGFLFVVILVVFLYEGGDLITEMIGKVFSIFNYITREGPSLYPNIGGSIAEQQHYSFQKIIERTTVTSYIFVLSVTGLFGLVVKRKKDCCILLLMAGIGLLGVFYAARFLIFLTPVLALGLGFFLSECWGAPKKIYKFLAISLLGMLAVSYHFHVNTNIISWPFIQRNDVHALVQVKKNTPRDAVVWSTWGKGYLINYWAERATVSDGAIHSGQLSHYLYWPLAQNDPLFAANFIKFFAARGISGIVEFRQRTGLEESEALAKLKDILSVDPASELFSIELSTLSIDGRDRFGQEEWRAFLFPENKPPVFLFLHQRMVLSSYWWYWYGSWDIDKHDGIHAKYGLFLHILLGENELTTIWGKHVDFLSGQVKRGEYTRQLAGVYVQDGRQLTQNLFPDGDGLLYVQRDINAAVLMDDILWDSVFNRLFIRQDQGTNNFQSFFLDKFNAQVWRVK